VEAFFRILYAKGLNQNESQNVLPDIHEKKSAKHFKRWLEAVKKNGLVSFLSHDAPGMRSVGWACVI
jgi:hypothetical protein